MLNVTTQLTESGLVLATILFMDAATVSTQISGCENDGQYYTKLLKEHITLQTINISSSLYELCSRNQR